MSHFFAVSLAHVTAAHAQNLQQGGKLLHYIADAKQVAWLDKYMQ